MRSLAIVGLVVMWVAAIPGTASAQIDQPKWGITIGFAPLWSVPSQLGQLFESDQFDIKGKEFRIGLIRGTTLGGEWGVSLIHKRFDKDSVLAIRQSNGVISVVTEDAEMLGAEVQRFFPFKRIRRAQIGLNLGGGLAEMRGFATGTVRVQNGADVEAPIRFSDVLELAGRDINVFPLGRAELGVATLVGDRVKVRVSGGFNMPGVQIASISVSWLLGTDR
jgi:hypothetical protein